MTPRRQPYPAERQAVQQPVRPWPARHPGLGIVKVGAIEEPEDARSTDHQVRTEFAATSFENNGPDLAAYGAFSVTNKPGADRNRAELVMQRDERGNTAQELTIEICDCFPKENFESCTNEVKVTVLGPQIDHKQ